MLTPSEMKDRTLRLVKEGNFIEGIYNYCDRWCEKCMFTAKCLNYESGKDAPDADSPELWDYLHNVFQATMLMLEEMMEEMGIDPEEIDKMETPEEFDPKDHPLYKKANDLAFTMHKWLDANKPVASLPDDPDILSSEKNKRFSDSVDVIYWYNFFIAAKIYRALIGTDEDEKDDIQTDSNGSAKIALIGLDRLIASWSVVMENMMEHQDEILKMLITLAEIRKQTEATFPHARKFKRPGFDQ